MTKYIKGKIVKALITGLEDYGIFVSLDNFYNGLIHISEISNGFVRNINDFVEVGETIYAKVIDVDKSRSHVRLSIKDIDYRLNTQAKKVQIVETGTGFKMLEENLQAWIDKKIKELT